MKHDDLVSLLKSARTIAVVGISDTTDRPSYRVATYLSRFYEIVPVNPHLESWEGRACYPSIQEIPTDLRIDIIDIFRRAEEVPRIVDAAIGRGIRCVWMQQGIVNDDAAWEAEQAGLSVVMDRCLAVEHQRLIARR